MTEKRVVPHTVTLKGEGVPNRVFVDVNKEFVLSWAKWLGQNREVQIFGAERYSDGSLSMRFQKAPYDLRVNLQPYSSMTTEPQEGYIHAATREFMTEKHAKADAWYASQKTVSMPTSAGFIDSDDYVPASERYTNMCGFD